MTEKSQLAGFNTLVMGPAGTGKTYAIGTLADAGMEVFVTFLESGLETLLSYWKDRGKEIPSNVHWHVFPNPTGTLAQLEETANKISTTPRDNLYKYSDPKRAQRNQFVTLLRVFRDFPDDRTGDKFGPVDSWGPNRCIVIDSLGGLNPMALSLVVGDKPVVDQGEWYSAQKEIEKLLRVLTDGCRCHFVLLAHIEREIDQVLGGSKITVSTLGAKLAPKLPPMFSDVILSRRDGVKFFWDTANSQADLKARNLPIADGQAPDFGVIVKRWQSRGGRFSANS